jgi:hypothetical protein
MLRETSRLTCVLLSALLACLSAAPALADPPRRPPPAMVPPASPPARDGAALPALPGAAIVDEVPEDTGLFPSITDQMVEKVVVLGQTAEHTHDLLQRGILQQVVGLDNFFGKPNSEKELHTSYLLRWRNSLRWEQGGGLAPGSTLRANLDLSRINERLQLAISGAGKPDQFSPSLPEDPGNPGFDRTFRSARIVNTELRYQLLRTPLAELFLGAGFDLAIPPQVFARARFQRLQRLGQFYLLQFGETLFVKTPYGFGETTELALERSLGPKTLLRLANSGTVSEELHGALEWGSELSLLHELSPKSALTVTAGIYGNTGSDDWVDNYRALVRYRRNFLREWLFYELEPQVSWPRRADGNFPVSYAFTVRLEVVFHGRETTGVISR